MNILLLLIIKIIKYSKNNLKNICLGQVISIRKTISTKITKSTIYIILIKSRFKKVQFYLKNQKIKGIV